MNSFLPGVGSANKDPNKITRLGGERRQVVGYLDAVAVEATTAIIAAIRRRGVGCREEGGGRRHS